MLARQRKQTGRRISPLREYREVNRLRSGLERTFTFRLIRLFSDIGNQAAQAVEAGGVASVRGLYPNIRRNVDSTLNSLYDETIKLFSDRAIANRRSAKAVATFEDLFESYIRSQGAERITQISTVTQRLIQDTIERNSTAGVPVIARAIEERFSPRFTRARASTIARTEVHSASSYATHEQQRSFGVPNMRKQWMANVDNRTRHTHAAVSGTQVEFDEDFSVGGRMMAYPGDPKGGPANVINCRCVLLYIEPDEEIDAPPPVIEAANPKRKPKRRDISAISIVGKTAAIKAMTARFAAAQRDYGEGLRSPDMEDLSRFRGRTSGSYGKAKAGTLNKEAASLTNALLEETDELAALCKVPRLRGLMGIRGSRALANMGDGVIGVKGASFNKIADRAVKPKEGSSDSAQIEANIATLEADKAKLLIAAEKEFGSWDDAFKKYVDRGKPGGFTAIEVERYSDFRDSIKALQSGIATQKKRLGYKEPPASAWKWGDDFESRPFTSDSYFTDDLDKLRSTIYHEFGHQVHQQYLVSSSTDFFNPLVERWMRTSAKKGNRKSATRYGDENAKEWFAENFSLYFMDREDLVDPLFIRLIDKIMDGGPLPYE